MTPFELRNFTQNLEIEDYNQPQVNRDSTKFFSTPRDRRGSELPNRDSRAGSVLSRPSGLIHVNN